LKGKPLGLLNRDYLQGSSRTTGGIFRGRALGSAFNFADADRMDLDPVNYTKTGKVLLYTSRDHGARPAMTISHDTVGDLPPVLEKLARKFSPIRSKSV